MTRYICVENCVNEALMRLNSPYGKQIWSRCILRKDRRCEVTANPIPKGTEAWRPITNANNRWHRISIEGMRRLEIARQTGNPL